jgi:geranylgeranyl pyrophosphate synthase
VEDAPNDEVDALVERMVTCGAKARVESRLSALTAEAHARIERLPLTSEGKSLLLDATLTLGARQQ